MTLRLTARIVTYFLLVAFVLISAVAFLSYRSARLSLEQAAISQVLAVALEKEAAIDTWFDERFSDTDQIAQQPDVTARVAVLKAASSASQAAAARALLLEDLRPHLEHAEAGYQELFVLDPKDGRVLVSTAPGEVGKIRAGPLSLAQSEASFSLRAPYYSTELQRLVMAASMPLLDANEHVVAVLGASWGLTSLNAIMQRRSGLRRTEDAFLINADQYPITQPRYLSAPVALRRRFDTETVRQCAQHNNGVLLARDYRGVPSIAVCRWMGKHRLGLIVKIDQAEAMAPAYALGLSILWFSGLGLLLAALAALFLARGLTRPLRALQERMRVFIGEDECAPTVRAQNKDEVSLLAEEFQRMSARVSERSEALEEINQTLRAEIAQRERMEKELRRFRLLLDRSLDSVIVVDPNSGQVLDVNERACLELGYSREQLLAATVFDLAVDFNREMFDGLVAQLRSRGALIFEAAAKRQDGTVFPVEVSASRVDADHEVAVAIVRDISQRKQMEAARDRMIAILDSTSDLVSIADPNGKLLYLNRAGRQQLGIGMDEDITQSAIPNFLPDPEHHPILLEGLPSAMREGSWRAETVIRSRSGVEFPVSQVILAHKTAAGQLDVYSTIMRDITARKQSEQQIRLAAGALASIAEGVLIADRDSKIVFANKAFTLASGYEPEEAIGRTPAFLQSGKQDAAFYENMWHTLRDVGHWQGEVWDKHKNGDLFPILLSLSAMRDGAGEVTHYVSVLSDISTSKHYQAQLEHQAHHDALTQLPNRLLFRMRLEAALTRARRTGKKLGLLFLDLDRFKIVNDTLGHSVGDALLRQASQRLIDALRETDTVARFGGDEFALLIDLLESNSAAANVAQKILDTLTQVFWVDDHELYVSASIGISIFPDDGDDIETLFKNADSAMYNAKAGGRNTYRFFSAADIDPQAIDRLELSNDLRQAIKREQLFLEFQPRFDCKTGSLSGMEALTRWRHPIRGLIPPAIFIPIAEQTGQMEQIGDWVLRTACQQIHSWREAGLEVQRVAVNLSALQFSRPALAVEMSALINEFQITPAMLELELTESVIMSDADGAIRLLGVLHELGFLIAIDDFGTGYSSLSYLKRFPISYLKIDQSFVAGVCDNADDAAITRAIIALARSLNLKVIAEGVETEGQYAFLKREACDEAQGFLLSRPVSAAAIATLLKKLDHGMVHAE